MALVACRECGRRISAKAANCPGCGVAQRKRRGIIGSLIRFVVFAFLGLIGLMILIAMLVGNNQQQRPADKQQQNAAEQPPFKNDPRPVAKRSTPDADKPPVLPRRDTAEDSQVKAGLLRDALLETSKETGKLIGSVSAKEDLAIFEVKNSWHSAPYQVRLQLAQNFWKVWASVNGAPDLDTSRIKLVDLNGNEVGGSRLLGGSLIWVQEK